MSKQIFVVSPEGYLGEVKGLKIDRRPVGGKLNVSINGIIEGGDEIMLMECRNMEDAISVFNKVLPLIFDPARSAVYINFINQPQNEMEVNSAVGEDNRSDKDTKGS